MKKPGTGYLSYAGVFWRSLAVLLVFQAAGWALAAGLAYLIAAPEMARDYYSAHETVKTTWKLLVPALAIAAAAGFLFVGLGSGIAVWRYSRRLHRPLQDLDGVLRRLAAGQISAPDAVPPQSPGAASEAAALLTPLRERVLKLQQLSKDLQKTVLTLDYKASGAVELTLKDLREIAGQLDAIAKDLDVSIRWFES